MASKGILTIFGQTFDCPCGKTHSIRPDTIVYADDAVTRAAEVCEPYLDGRRAVVLADVRTRGVAGEGIAEALTEGGWDVREVTVPDPADGESPVCDDRTKAALTDKVAETDIIVAVGSGVISDLGKWLAFDAGIPYVSFATAASMNGYASANVAPAIDGVKTLLSAAPPVAVMSSPQVLADAPYEMTASGLGDALAKSVSSVDWRLNHLLFGDFYCERSVGLIAEIEPLYLEHPEDILSRKPAAMEALFNALLLTGAAMTMADTSAPASGGEHLISHSLDMLASIDGQAHDLHGRQVGIGTVMMAELYRRVLAVESPRWQDAPAAVDRRFWGPLADVVAEHYANKADRLVAAKATLEAGDAWDRLRGELSGMLRAPGTIHGCLSAAKAACRAADIGCSVERLRQVFGHAHEIRPRFTILDLAYLTGVLPGAIDEIVTQWG